MCNIVLILIINTVIIKLLYFVCTKKKSETAFSTRTFTL